MKDPRVILAGVVWLGLSLLLWSVGARPAVVVLAGIVAVAVALLSLLADLVDAAHPITWPQRRDDRRAVRPTDPFLRPLRNQIDADRRFGSTELHATLVALIDERAADGATLTPALAALRAGPPRPVTSVRELRQIISDIEAL